MILYRIARVQARATIHQQRGHDMVSGLRRKIGQVESEGERIYYETTGTGPPVVLCDGLGGNHIR
jgi:hypothetical protein